MTRPRCLVFRLMLSGALIAAALPAAAQSVPDDDQRPALRRLVLVAGAGDAVRPPLLQAQFMPGMPAMPNMPGMMVPVPVPEMQPAMGGMAMIMTGETLLEMMAGACAAGLFVGGAAVVATAPAAPVTAPLVLSSAAVGCGFAIGATAAGMGGMIGWRALYTRFLK
jgi:hypothetical protein